MRLLPLMLAGLVTATTPALAQSVPAPRYVVAIGLARDDQVVEAPSVTLPLGSAASVEITGRYRIETALMQAEGDRVTLATTIFRPEADQWVVVARPELTLTKGQLVTVHLTDAGWDSVDLSVRLESDLTSHPGT